MLPHNVCRQDCEYICRCNSLTYKYRDDIRKCFLIENFYYIIYKAFPWQPSLLLNAALHLGDSSPDPPGGDVPPPGDGSLLSM